MGDPQWGDHEGRSWLLWDLGVDGHHGNGGRGDCFQPNLERMAKFWL